MNHFQQNLLTSNYSFYIYVATFFPFVNTKYLTEISKPLPTRFLWEYKSDCSFACKNMYCYVKTGNSAGIVSLNAFK